MGEAVPWEPGLRRSERMRHGDLDLKNGGAYHPEIQGYS